MTILDYGILLLLALWAAGAILYVKRHGSCSGGSSCGKCGGSCGGCGEGCGRCGSGEK